MRRGWVSEGQGAPAAYAVPTRKLPSHAQSSVERLFKVRRSCFNPSPAVDSSVLRFTPRPSPFKNAADEENFYRTVRAAFSQRRKVIHNSLTHSLGMPPEKVNAALEGCGLSGRVRAETLSVPDFMRLSEMLYNP